MSLLSYNELVELASREVIAGVKPGAINATSIDIHLGGTVLVERGTSSYGRLIDYSKRDKPNFLEVKLDDAGYVLMPGDFMLAQSVEVFNLPEDISCEYKLKSSMARIGLEHMNAGWCDAGWHGSVLTLEFKNMLQHHSIRLRPGDAIGQMVFFRHSTVPADKSYAARGRYNKDLSVSAIKV